MKRFLLILGIPAAAILGVVFMSSMRTEPPKKEPVDTTPLVEVRVAELMTADFEVRSQGTVQPRTETVLSAEVSGTVTSISPQFVAGGFFGANEILMRIDPTNYETALIQAEAVLEQRQIEYDGAKKLRSQGYRAESEYASANAALATAEAERVRAKRNLERTFIRLPYDGMVKAKESDLGQFVSAGSRVGVVFATDAAEVRLPLTDLDLAFVELPDRQSLTGGPEVTLSAVQRGQLTEWSGRIIRTEGVVDEKSRVTYAVALIEDPYQLKTAGSVLPIGTFVAATIVGSAAENVVQIPRSMVRGSNQIMLVDDDNKLRLRTINIVRSDADYVYVRDSIAAGERLIATKLESPVNGMAVRTHTNDESET